MVTPDKLQKYIYIYRNTDHVYYVSSRYHVLPKYKLIWRYRDIFPFYRTVCRMIKVFLHYTFHHYFLMKQESLKNHFQGDLIVGMRLGGYKVFCFQRQQVLTKYPDQMDPLRFKEQVDNAVLLAKHALGPGLIEYNLPERYYIQPFIHGCKPQFLCQDWSVFHTCFAPLLEMMIRSSVPLMVDQYQYVKDQLKEISQSKVKLNKRLFSNEFFIIENFIHRIAFLSAFKKEMPLRLILSHGDLSEFNLLVSPGSVSAIDWDMLSYRTPLYDFYTLFFKTLEFKKRPTFDELNRQMADAFHFMVNRDEMAATRDLLSTISLANRQYCHIFYLEFIAVIMQELTYQESEKCFKRRFRHLLKWIEIFTLYEDYMLEHTIPVIEGESVEFSDVG